LGNIERLFNGAGEIFDAANHIAMLDTRHRNAENVRFLKGIIADGSGRYSDR
jgi:hypothetical protein